MILEIDPARCTGCRACELFCALAHEGQVNPELSRIRVLEGAGRRIILPLACPPCEQKACLAACPEPGALRVEANGAVVIVEALCTACARCARACAIGAIRIQRLAGRGKKGRAVALKCDLCGGNPWCARVCSSGAILARSESFSGQAVFLRLLAVRGELNARENLA